MHDPNTPPQGSADCFSLILALRFGLWGGVARYVNEVLQEKRKFHFFELWIAAMVSGFCGVLIGLLALRFAMEAYLVMFGAGMAGGIGWQTVGWLFSLAKWRAARLAAEDTKDRSVNQQVRTSPKPVRTQDAVDTVRSVSATKPGSAKDLRRVVW